MFLGLKILGACALGISCVVSASWLANNKAVGADDDSPSIWKVADKSSFPILTCSNDKARIVVSLDSKAPNGSQTLKEKDVITFTGYEEKTKQPVNLLAQTGWSGGKDFQLIIFEDTGNHWIGETGGEHSHKYGDNLKCGEGVFAVPNKKRWEKGLDQLKLTPENCQNKNGKKECEIKIADTVGLNWNDGFNPKVIF